jgi:hypothetical protein
MSENEPKQETAPAAHFDGTYFAVRKAMREAILTHARMGRSFRLRVGR